MPERASRPVEVALFIPCYVDQLAPEVGLASATVLERLGCKVTFDPRQTCCGQPFVTTGAHAEAVRLARAHATVFAGAQAVVCPSASCVATVRRRYAELLGETLSKPLAARTFELGEFIVLSLETSDVGAVFPHRVALLESCHGLRPRGDRGCGVRAPGALSGRRDARRVRFWPVLSRRWPGNPASPWLAARELPAHPGASFRARWRARTRGGDR